MAQAEVAEVSAPPTTGQKFAAEAIGTFVLVLFGCGSVVIAGEQSGAGDDTGLAFIVSIGLTFGLAVMVMSYAVGRISGGHFNPAVSLGAALGGRIAWSQVPMYVGAQLAGAILGAAVLLGLMLGFDGFSAFDDSLGANSWGDDGSGYALWAAILIELVLTAIFVFVILAVTDERNEHHTMMAPLTIGLTLAAIHFVAIPATGTSVNPARSIGPALFSGTDLLLQVWVFILGPLLGAAAAGLLYPAVFGHATGPVAGSGLSFGKAAAAGVPGYGMDQYQQQWSQQSPGAYQPPVGGYAATDAYGQPAAADPYQQQAAQQQAQQPAQHAQQPAEQPIIQDGWQWDPQAQQWIPAQQQPPQQGWPSPGQGGGGESTQVRPPE